ncbi:MAG: hypothetical protein KF716_16145 [Anaerolineae bacterium]|nr:hypothetical protein [Anaerolineae bacterium]
MQQGKFGRLLLSLAIGLVVLIGLGAAHFEAQAEETTIRSYGGLITGADDIFVAVVAEGDKATVYICDGIVDKGTVSIAEWFIGAVKDNAIDIIGPTGNRVEVALTEATATGKFTFTDGAVKEFVIELLPESAGLFRSEFAIGDHKYVGGWLVLPDGSVRGAVRFVETGELVPASFSEFHNPSN